jgi:hypothetical protein
MSAASFEEEIRDGVIPLPSELAARFHGRVHVVVWSEDDGPTSEAGDLIDELIDNPLPPFEPFIREEIYRDR